MNQQMLYKKNMDFFASRLAGIAKQIILDFPTDPVRVIPAKTEDSFFLESKNSRGFTVPLHSRYDPRREAGIWAANQDLTTKRHVLLFGFGLGYHVEALLELYPDKMIYVYEPDRRLFFVSLRWRDWTVFPWGRVKKFVLDENGCNCSSLIKSIFSVIKEDWTFLSIPAIEGCYADAFSSFKQALLYEKDMYARSLVIDSQLQKEWTVNAVKNVPYELRCKSIFSYQEMFDQQTVIVVASGPSLDAAIPYLRQIKQNQKAIILAISSSINVLIKNDLEPDFHITFDATEASYVELAASLKRNIPLIFGSTTRHEIVKVHRGPKAFFVVDEDTVLPFLTGAVPREQILEDAYSIAVPALKILDKLKVKNVIFAGQDLAYYQDNKYARGVSVLCPDEKASANEVKAYVETVANNGETVYTSAIFNVVRSSLEEIIANGQFTSVYNPSPHAAKIAGAQFVSWDELLMDLPDGKFLRDSSFLAIEGRMSIKKMRKRLLDVLDRLDLKLTQLYRQAEKILVMDMTEDRERVEKQFKALDMELAQITAVPEYERLVFPMVRNEHHILKKYAPDISQMTIIEKKELVNNQYRKYLSGVRLSLIKLRDAINTWE